MSDLVKRLRIKAGVIEMGEMIAWGSDSALMREAADALEMAAPAVQGEPPRKEIYKEFSEWCQNNRSFDLDCRLHTHAGPIDHGGYISDEKTRVAFAAYRAGRLYAPQPAPDVTQLVEALESLLEVQDEDCRYDHQGYCQNHNLDHVADGCRVARAKTALAAHRKQQEQSND